MKIAIIGLGLIGGSFARAFKKYTDHEVRGFDRDEAALNAALKDMSIAGIADDAFLSEADLIISALPPVASAEYLLKIRNLLKNGAIATDIAGVKQYLHDRVYLPLAECGVVYVGSHPMAGKEVSGYKNSDADLFRGASFLITPVESTQENAVETLRTLAYELGFSNVVATDPLTHDRKIAYTSQLAHVVSNAYVKSPTVSGRAGFSAGSFQDMTRVAKLDEELWADLMILNREALLAETVTLIDNLNAYRDALQSGNRDAVRDLLKEGKERKLEDEQRNRRE